MIRDSRPSLSLRSTWKMITIDIYAIYASKRRLACFNNKNSIHSRLLTSTCKEEISINLAMSLSFILSVNFVPGISSMSKNLDCTSTFSTLIAAFVDQIISTFITSRTQTYKITIKSRTTSVLKVNVCRRSSLRLEPLSNWKFIGEQFMEKVVAKSNIFLIVELTWKKCVDSPMKDIKTNKSLFKLKTRKG
jgi:hypothetical protein